MADGASSIAGCGEISGSAGESGRGKLMIGWVTSCSADLIDG